jgi:cation-transporting P-type ATPase E
MVRYNPTIDMGLTSEQVKVRILDGLVNFDDQPKTKSIKQIIHDNFFTYFNFLNTVLGLAIFIASLINGQMLNGLKNCLFMGVIIINSIISIIEEVISKKIIDKLSVVNESNVTVVRNGKKSKLKLNELVLDDIVELSTGHQIVADSIIVSGEVEVNESLLTGEPDAIIKKVGDMLLSGSYIVSGNCYARVDHIGADNYAATISKEAKYEKKVNSVIMNSFEKLLKVLSLLIIPIGIIMYFSQYKAIGSPTEAVFTTVAALIGMIPEGLVLLTSSVMAVSIIRLSKYKVLVQQLYCIETLARVDLICLDKTGTLTEGKMAVVDFKPFKNHKQDELEEAISAFAQHSEDSNPTMNALKAYFKMTVNWPLKDNIPFSSDRKYSGIKFDDTSYYLGAPEVLLKDNLTKINADIEPYQKDYRVVVLAKKTGSLIKDPTNLTPIGFVIIEDVIRPDAKDTLDYFKVQGVKAKIISGDNATTVLNIAKKVGLDNIKGINIGDMKRNEIEAIASDYDVFGRVNPVQKKWLVEIYQHRGHTVAMTGDGVNDVLALKQSDCAISVASGADAARNVAQLVLLNNNFNALPEVVAEGRRTVNNIERSGSLLLVKTIYTILLIFFSIIISAKYFFIPIQLTLITAFTIGTPSFILALEPNSDLIKGDFLLKIVSRALPASLTVVFNIVLVTCFVNLFGLSYELQTNLCVFLTTVTGFIYLYKICQPFTWVRRVLLSVMIIGFIYCLFWQYRFFNLMAITPTIFIIGFVLSIDSIYIYHKINWFITWLFHFFDKTIVIEKD